MGKRRVAAALEQEIHRAFPPAPQWPSDEFIEAHADLLYSAPPADDLLEVVPAYMAWCTRNTHQPASLVFDYTVSALATFGRTKDPAPTGLHFKHLCSDEQQHVVAAFLRWCRDDDLLLHEEQILRALKHWPQ